MTPAEEWERCRPWLETALDHDDCHDIADVLTKIEAREAEFWPFERCAFVTEILTYPKRKVFNCWLAGGELAAIREALPVVEAWGREQGCRLFYVTGRPGWARALREFGYEPRFITAAKEVA